MTEADWLGSADPVQMLAYLNRPQGDRKLLLFAMACCRKIRPLLPQPEMQDSLALAERYAEGDVSLDELNTPAGQLFDVLYEGAERYANSPEFTLPEPFAPWLTDSEVSPATAFSMLFVGDDVDVPKDRLRLLLDAAYFGDCVLGMHSRPLAVMSFRRFLNVALLRDIFGNPFRTRPRIDPAWLSWNDNTAANLATSIYADRAFENLPILGDALEDAGCHHQDVLDHCRQPGEHVRGCWVVDLVLAKE